MLVADADPVFSLMLGRFFERKGWDVVIAADAAQALDGAGTHPRPDVIVLDVGLLGGEDTALLQILKAAPSTALIPVIATCDTLRGDLEEHVRARGASHFVHKPVDPASLATIVEAVGSGARRPETG